MRVGIYNRWLPTMGGGEKHMLAIAEFLSAGHAVEVLAHQAVNRGKLESKLHVDLSRVSLRCIPDLPDEQLAAFTGEYDLFINASHMNFIPSQARHSFMLVYFPTPVDLSPWGLFKRRVGLWLKRQLLVPDYAEGFYGPEPVAGRRCRWTTGRARLRLPVPLGAGSLRLHWVLGRPAGPGPADVRFSIDGQEVGSCRLLPHQEHFTAYDLMVDYRETSPLTIEIQTDTFRSDGDGDQVRELGVAVASVEVRHPRYRLYKLLFERLFKELGLRLHGIPPQLFLDHLDTYDLICANSQFTRRWIRRYWRHDSAVLYPPIDVDAFAPLPKRDIILSVGRFFAGSHNKKHLTMIQAFKRMVDQELSGWQLHLAGGTTPGQVHHDYLKRVRSEAAGSPIHLHPDVPFPELARLYGESKIYWHASGYGEDVEREPIRFEHFGITTVEAMAAGCVPVVIGKAGQLEVVRHGVDGFLWHTLSELQRYTRDLIRDEDRRCEMSQRATERSRAFDRKAFERRLAEILDKLGMGYEGLARTR